MAIDPVNAIGGAVGNQASQSTAAQATSAFGLSFQDLLKIVLTQLTYQDPLKPMDNFQFVSQLAQFSQIQQSQEMVDSLTALVAAQTTGQAASLLGKTVDVASGPGTVSGKVVAVAFSSGNPAITIETANGSTISSLPLGSVSQIREAN
jgi:flagellar basal-body rod modification protein FlgD